MGEEKKTLLKMKELIPDMVEYVFGREYQENMADSARDELALIVDSLDKITSRTQPMDDIDAYIDVSEAMFRLIKSNQSLAVIGYRELKQSQDYLLLSIENLVELYGLRTTKAGAYLLYNKFKSEIESDGRTHKDIMDSVDRMGRYLGRSDNLFKKIVEDFLNNFDDLFPDLQSQKDFSAFLKMAYFVDTYLRKSQYKEEVLLLEKKIVALLSKTIKHFLENFGTDLALQYLATISEQLPLRYRKVSYKLMPADTALQLKLFKKVDISSAISQRSSFVAVAGIMMEKAADGNIVEDVVRGIRQKKLSLRDVLDIIKKSGEQAAAEIMSVLSEEDRAIIGGQVSQGPVIVRSRR